MKKLILFVLLLSGCISTADRVNLTALRSLAEPSADEQPMEHDEYNELTMYLINKARGEEAQDDDWAWIK